jgi:hypothetical protein
MMAGLRVIVAGSRGITDLDVVTVAILNAIREWQCQRYIAEIVSGGARGVDKLGEEWAQRVDCPIKRFPANWKLHGMSAGIIRNEQMARYADALVAVWDGKSRGTRHMIETMRALGKKVYVHNALDTPTPSRV